MLARRRAGRNPFLGYSGNESTGFYFCHGANVASFISKTEPESISVDT